MRLFALFAFQGALFGFRQASKLGWKQAIHLFLGHRMQVEDHQQLFRDFGGNSLRAPRGLLANRIVSHRTTIRIKTHLDGHLQQGRCCQKTIV